MMPPLHCFSLQPKPHTISDNTKGTSAARLQAARLVAVWLHLVSLSPE
jgi:hypothetical protein